MIAVAIVAIGGYVLSLKASGWMRQHGALPLGVRTARIVISVIAVVLVAAILFISFGPISVVSGVTFSAIVGLAATLALQTTISNLIGGFILLRNRVLRVNDNIQISGTKGKVIRIGLITTWLCQEDGALVSVSNSTLLSGPLVNLSASDRLKGEY
jgi:small conductance mechanosensitive channel